MPTIPSLAVPQSWLAIAMIAGAMAILCKISWLWIATRLAYVTGFVQTRLNVRRRLDEVNAMIEGWMQGLASRTQLKLATRLKGLNPILNRLCQRFLRFGTTYDEHQLAAKSEVFSENRGPNGELEPPDQHPTIPTKVYLPVQLLVGFVDVCVTAISFEAAHISVVSSWPLALLIGSLLAWAGHFSGLLLRARETFLAGAALSIILYGSSLALVGVRIHFAIVHTPTIAVSVSIFFLSWAILLPTLSIIVAAYHRGTDHATKAIRAKGKQAGVAVDYNRQRAIYSAIAQAIVNFAKAIYAAYKQGAIQGWTRGETLTFPILTIVIPTIDPVDATPNAETTNAEKAI